MPSLSDILAGMLLTACFLDEHVTQAGQSAYLIFVDGHVTQTGQSEYIFLITVIGSWAHDPCLPMSLISESFTKATRKEPLFLCWISG